MDWQSESPELWAFLESLHRGDIVSGTVATIERFGVFVSLDDGPAHPLFPGVGFIVIPELSWRYIEAPADVVQVGQRVSCEFLQFDTYNAEARLSLKALEPDPLQAALGTPSRRKPTARPSPSAQRLTVERAISRLKVATRYERRHYPHPGTVTVAALTIWPRNGAPGPDAPMPQTGAVRPGRVGSVIPAPSLTETASRGARPPAPNCPVGHQRDVGPDLVRRGWPWSP